MDKLPLQIYAYCSYIYHDKAFIFSSVIFNQFVMGSKYTISNIYIIQILRHRDFSEADDITVLYCLLATRFYYILPTFV